MCILKIFFLILLISITHGQNISVQFQKFPVDTDIGSCTCDLTVNACDVSCCCDADCSSGDQQAFGCNLRDNKYTNSTPVISSVQPTCIKNISIFKSNSPYIIQKMGELVCIDYERYKGSQYYQQPTAQTLDPSLFLQGINAEYGVSPPSTISTNQNTYQVGTPILFISNANNETIYYSLPVKIFNNQLCSGSQTITYMNNFTSTCNQVVDSATCTGALNPLTYINPLCLIRSPSDPGRSNSICDNTSVSVPTFSASSCSGALQSLTVRIYYDSSIGIQSINLTYTPTNASGLQFQQTFTVNFIKTVPTSTSSNTTRSPGYRQGAFITAAIGNSSTLTTLDPSMFSILKPSSDGFCSGILSRTPIRFGENVRSTCKHNAPSTNLNNLFMPTNGNVLYVAAYTNSDPSNVARDWLPVIYCISDIGSPNPRTCSNSVVNTTSGINYYIKLDIQIAYTNIGSVNNPQSVLSAVIFHYQGISPSSLSSPFLVMESVTFQDISEAPIVVQGQIPAPNTRLPANFFYPFSVSHATKSMTFSSVFYLMIVFLFLLM